MFVEKWAEPSLAPDWLSEAVRADFMSTFIPYLRTQRRGGEEQ